MKSEKIKERLNKYILDKPSNWLEQIEKYEIDNEWLDKSALIAIKILSTLKSKSISQKDLAESIGVSPQYINKVVKGSENLSLETICKIEKSLGINLISVPYYEKSQVITDNFAPLLSFISRNDCMILGSESTDYKTESSYQNQEEPIAA